MTTCKSCSATINQGEEAIVCEGFCANTYHCLCVNLSTDGKKSYLQNPYMLWICTTCSKMLREIRYGKAMQEEYRSFTSSSAGHRDICASDKCEVSNEIVGIKKEIAAIHRALADLSASRLDPSCISSMTEQPIANSSPISSVSLMHGTRVVNRRLDVQPESPSRINSTGEKCWLFFTRVKNNVSEREIHTMVAESLDSTDAIEVKKLVPDWKDTSLLPFVSFKVGINVRLKDKALRSSTWPEGICFREFRERNYMWEPQRYV